MATNYQKIRVGAPDSMLLDQGLTGQIDIGASTGGAVFGYNATYLPIEIDQAIMPVNAYKTKEDILFSVSLVQEAANSLMAALSLASSSLTTTVAGTLIAPSPVPTVALAPGATGATASYTYQVAAVDGYGDSIPAPAVAFTTGPTTLSSTNALVISGWGAVAGAVGYRVIRFAGGTTQGAIGFVPLGAARTFTDTGIAATPYTAATVAPVLPNTDQILFGGNLAVPFHAFDWSVPKNDGTLNHWRGHLNRCFSAKQISIDYKRDKVTELSKMELMGLADTTQPVGQQGGWLIEEY